MKWELHKPGCWRRYLSAYRAQVARSFGSKYMDVAVALHATPEPAPDVVRLLGGDAVLPAEDTMTKGGT